MTERESLFQFLRPERWGDLSCLDWGWFYAEWGDGIRLRFGRLSVYGKVKWSRV